MSEHATRPSPAHQAEPARVPTFPDPAFDRRFWSKVRFGPGCWEWAGSLSPQGYGRFSVSNYPEYAHRLVYELVAGPIPAGLYVCHHCDNRKCVRPDHLFAGSHQDNTDDMVAKGRHAHGEASGRAKVVAASVMDIRRRYADGGGTQQELAEEHRLSGSHVCRIISGKFWSHVPQEDGGIERLPAVKHSHRVRGERVHGAKLTPARVVEIRRLFLSGEQTNMAELGRQFGVSKANVRHIILGKTWKHVREGD